MKPNMVMVIVLVSLLVVLSLFAVVRYTDILKPVPATSAAGEEKRLFADDPKGVAKVTIAPSAGKEISLVRKDGHWRLSKPVDAPADEAVISGMLNVLKYLRYQKVYPAGDRSVGDALTGLDQPLWRVTMVEEGGRAYTLLVGQAVPWLGDSREQTYVRPEGDKRTFVVAENLAETLRRGAGEYRDKTVLKFAAADAQRLRVEGQQSFELRKVADGWRVVQPSSSPADAGKVAAMVESLAQLRAEEFVDDKVDPASLGLKRGEETLLVCVNMKAPAAATTASAPASAPAATTASKPAEGPSYQIAFGAIRGNSVYAMRLDQPGVFKVPVSVLQGLRVDLADVRERKVLDFVAPAVERVELALPSGTNIDLSRNRMAGQWMMTKPREGKANPVNVDKLLARLESLSAYRFLDAAAKPEMTGLDKPQIAVTLHLMGKDKPLKLLVGQAALSADETYVSAGEQTVVVRGADLAALKADAATYWSSELLALPFDGRVTELSIQRPGDKLRLKADDADVWSMVEPVKAKTDANAVLQLVGFIRNLNALEILALGDKVPARYADANEVIRVAVTVATEIPMAPESQPATAPASRASSQPATASAPASGPAFKKVETTYRIVLARADGKICAWVEGQPLVAVGELPTAVWVAAAAELRERVLMSLAPADVDSIKITAGGQTTELRRNSEGWQCESSRHSRIDSQKVQTYLENMVQIQAVRFAAGEEVKDAGTPSVTVELTSSKAATVKISLFATGPAGTKDRYAAVSGLPGTAVLDARGADIVSKSLRDFEK